MLIQIESRGGKEEAQQVFERSLRSSWANREMRRISWRPSGVDLRINHNGRFWFGSRHPSPDNESKIRRYWTPFGEYRESGSLGITVEAYVPTDTNSKQVSAFFARDSLSGAIFLMHDGGVGGGQPGIGRSSFLAKTGARLLDVATSENDLRLGLVVTRIDAPAIGANVARFVQQVIDFKTAVRNGETASLGFKEIEQSYKDYYAEFSGRSKRARIEALECFSRHGDIVAALHEWRRPSLRPGDRTVKNRYIDLGVLREQSLIELYEVKPTCDRSELYSALGQLMVYDTSSNGTCKRHVVLPAGETVPADIAAAFQRSSISIIRFKMTGDEVSIAAD